MKKTILIALLVAILAMTLAVPVFADPPVVPQACYALLQAATSAFERGDLTLSLRLHTLAGSVCPI